MTEKRWGALPVAYICHDMCSLAATIALRTMQGEGRSQRMRYPPTIRNRQLSCLLQHLMPYDLISIAMTIVAAHSPAI